MARSGWGSTGAGSAAGVRLARIGEPQPFSPVSAFVGRSYDPSRDLGRQGRSGRPESQRALEQGFANRNLADFTPKGPRFDLPVPAPGYEWWYLDALSDDGRSGLTLIAFIGSVFSPYYAWSGRKAPLNHCAINVALYGAPCQRWAMTERSHRAVSRSADHFAVGPSALQWDGTCLRATIDELAVPHMTRLKGEVRLYPKAITKAAYAIDADHSHIWWPVAPIARVEVAFEKPAVRWSGEGYFDSNRGTVALEETFQRWDWSRGLLPSGETAVLYDVLCRNGDRRAMALRLDDQGEAEAFAPPPVMGLPRTRWQVKRFTQAEDGQAKVLKTLEDTPFYARSVIKTRLLGQDVTAMHESLNLDSFRNPLVRAVLPFRMPRVWWR